MKPANQPIQCQQVSPGRWESIDADVIVETPVSLTVNGDVWLTFMCTPVDLEYMAVGFLFNEGLIKSANEVADVRLCASGDNVDVWLSQSVEKPDKWRRTSGCTGGMTSVLNESPAQLFTNGGLLSANQVGELINQLFESQQLYRASGGVHTSALSDGQRIWIVAEDIGRHNTLDKIAGRCLLDRINPPRRIILTTGRISSEMLQKSARLKASTVISRTSPSSLSIELAQKWGITLIGYARRNRFNIYTHPERVLFAPESKGAEKEPIFA
jgi:FdhD protein